MTFSGEGLSETKVETKLFAFDGHMSVLFSRGRIKSKDSLCWVKVKKWESRVGCG